jgi:UDP-N-acetyl-D-glucosamine dehydrogenase
VTDRVEEALAARGKKLADARVLVLGAAYKPDVDDDRESPALQLMKLLESRGADFAYSDPHVPALRPGREHSFTLRSVELTPETLRGFDVAVLVTDHQAFDYGAILEHAPLIVDTRNAFARFLGERAAASGKVLKA